MKLALVYNPKDSKLLSSAYSWTYRDMFMAICEQFPNAQHVTESIPAEDIHADVILFYDVHSNHEIEISGVADHPAVKVEYFNDPHQKDQHGIYQSTGQQFHKLGAEQRCNRARLRGVSHIICPYRNGYDTYIAPHAGEMEHIWLPVSPRNRRSRVSPLAARIPAAVLSGHMWPGDADFKPYQFRRQVAESGVATLDTDPAYGSRYQGFLSRYAGGLALCDAYVVPKYIEIMLAGCVCLCQWHSEMASMGFMPGANCVVVSKEEFKSEIEHFNRAPSEYQAIADAGRALALREFTSARFAQKLQNKLVEIATT